MQIVDGIYQVQLPLPFPLRIINAYVLRDGDGWTIVDAGINYPAARVAWQAAFNTYSIDPRAIQRILLTHAHPDHYGLAGWLAEQSGACVYLAPAEQAFAQRVWRTGLAHEQATIDLFVSHGMPFILAEQIRQSMIDTRAMTAPWPETRSLEPGAQLQVGSRSFEVLATPGHSDQHVAFYCAADRLLLCGDTVLIKITPNISLWPNGRPDPLADFLHSLDVLSTRPVDLALPGHGPLIDRFAQRIAELRAHHQVRLQQMEQAVGSGATAFDVCSALFPISNLSPHQLRFAIAETLAHMEYLVGRGRLVYIGGQYHLAN